MAAGDGLISMTPTSIAYSGTSASINADGGVDFSAVTSLSLNGVFTGDYDNYLIVIGGYPDGLNINAELRLRVGGVSESGSNYTRQYLVVSGTTISSGRVSSDNKATLGSYELGVLQNLFHVHIYGPFLAQPTALRSVTANSVSGANIHDNANTHSLSTSYDGFELLQGSGRTVTGTVHVFGYEE